MMICLNKWKKNVKKNFLIVVLQDTMISLICKGKYKYYIEECASIRNKEIKKAKAIDGTYKLKYENVISEKEVKKDEMIKKKKDDYITEYVVCLYDEYDEKINSDLQKQI